MSNPHSQESINKIKKTELYIFLKDNCSLSINSQIKLKKEGIMSDINKQKSVDIQLQSGRFKILTTNNEYKSFKGLTSGYANKITKYKNNRYTPDHQIMVNGAYKKVKDLKGSKTANVEDTKVFDILHVEDTHCYISNDTLNKNCLILN